MNPIDAVAEAIREQAQDLARQAVAIVRREEPTVEGVVLMDERTDQLRETRIWHATDPETGEECVLRLRVARGRIVDVEREGSAAPLSPPEVRQGDAAQHVAGGEA